MTEQTSRSSYFPAFLNLRGKPAVVVGGGEVAFRKVESLLSAGASVKVIAPQLHVGLESLAERGRLEVVKRDYRTGDLLGAMLAIGATSDSEVNQQLAREADGSNIFLNVVDAPNSCSFIVPSVIRRDELTVAISTGGLSPALAKRMRQKLEETLVPEYGAFLRLLGTLRSTVRTELPLSAQREAFWAEVVNSDAFDRFRARGEDAALERIDEILRRVRDGEPCTILAVGLNHTVAPVEIRERFALDADKIGGVLDGLNRLAREQVIISTCNRMEVYLVPEHPRQAVAEARAFLSSTFCPGSPESEVAPYLYSLHNVAAARHLFSVASGIDSMILGEPQILGQVRDAYELAAEGGHAGPLLSALFQRALATGKRARTETAISRNAASVSHAAVELARDLFGDLSTRAVLVVGAGEMGQLAAKNLVDNGVQRLMVLNRTLERAEELAGRLSAEAYAWTDTVAALAQADIVVTSTGSSEAIFRADVVAEAMRERRQRPLFLVDIAVPRDVDPAVGELENVFLYDIDDLRSIVDANLKERRREVPLVEAIVDAEVASFAGWLHCQEVVPTIVSLRRKLDGIRKSEVARHEGKLGLSPRDRNTLEALTTAIVNKILHGPTMRLKAQATDGACGLYVDAVKDLFDLDDAS